jgi:hypothetical protein
MALLAFVLVLAGSLSIAGAASPVFSVVLLLGVMLGGLVWAAWLSRLRGARPARVASGGRAIASFLLLAGCLIVVGSWCLLNDPLWLTGIAAACLLAWLPLWGAWGLPGSWRWRVTPGVSLILGVLLWFNLPLRLTVGWYEPALTQLRKEARAQPLEYSSTWKSGSWELPEPRTVGPFRIYRVYICEDNDCALYQTVPGFRDIRGLGWVAAAKAEHLASGGIYLSNIGQAVNLNYNRVSHLGGEWYVYGWDPD